MPPNGTIRYGFGTGIIADATSAVFFIDMSCGRRARTYEHLESRVPPDRLAPGTPVLCSWLKEPQANGGAPGLLDPRAIEPVDWWNRKAGFPTAYPETSLATGKAIESMLVDLLWQGGLRADHATIFEDEILHTDLWVLLFWHQRWDWIPIDITLLPLEACTDESPSKLSLGRMHGVIPIRISTQIIEKSPRQLTSWMVATLKAQLTRFSGIQLLTRQEAYGRESAWLARNGNCHTS